MSIDTPKEVNDENTEEESATVQFADMSDEEYAEVDVEALVQEAETATDVETTEAEETQAEPDESDTPQEPSEEEPTTKEDEEVAIEAPESDSKDDSSEEAVIDYESLYKGVTEPLKANGKMVDITDVAELRKLAQMGMNYVPKMTSIKQYRKRGKQLDDNGIDDETLAFLIDVKNGKPEAIEKLLKDKAVDPMDLDLEKENTYKPEPYTVSDSELEMQEVKEALKGSTYLQPLLNDISTKWDDKSSEELMQNPKDIEVLHAHMEEGIYDQIVSNLDKQKALGNTQGMSDVSAYKAIFKQMYPDTVEEVAPQIQQPAMQETKVEEVAKAQKVKQDKLAATSTVKPSSKKTVLPDSNISDMSDEEFDAFKKEFKHLL